MEHLFLELDGMEVNCKKLIYLILWFMFVICFIIISLIRFPYKTETLVSHKTGELLNISGKSYLLIDIKQTSNTSSIHYFLKDENEFYVVSFKRFPYWNRYDSSHIMPLEDGSIYEYPDYYSKGIITRNGEQLSFSEQKYISWQVITMPFALIVVIFAVFGKRKNKAIS